MSTEAPGVIVDEALLAKLDHDRQRAAANREVQEVKAEAARHNASAAAQRVTELDAVRQFLEARIGVPLAEVAAELERELGKAESAVAEKTAIAELRREELRDWEGYRRILKHRVADLQDGSTEGEQ